MYGVIITLIIIIAVLLILVVLAQNPKGGGLSSQFGGSGSAQLMGVKKTGDVLEKLTWGFAIAILLLSISTNFVIPEQTQEGLTSPTIENVQQDIIPSSPIESGSNAQEDAGNGLDALLDEGTSSDSTGN